MSGGFRWPWLARVTNGRFGLGCWTQEEVDLIHERARERYERLAPHIDGPLCPGDSDDWEPRS